MRLELIFISTLEVTELEDAPRIISLENVCKPLSLLHVREATLTSLMNAVPDGSVIVGDENLTLNKSSAISRLEILE